MAVVTLMFDLLTLKLVRESHLRWGTFIPKLGTLGLRVLQLFAMYATDGQTDGRKQRLMPTVGSIINGLIIQGAHYFALIRNSCTNVTDGCSPM